MVPTASKSAPVSALLFAFLLIPVAPIIQAQETSEKTISRPSPVAGPTKATAKGKKLSAAAKAKAEQQRALALSLLVSLSNEARSFRNQTLRARTLARIADGLWEVDPDQSRTLFQKAWDAADVADEEAGRLFREDMQRQQAGGGGAVGSLPPNLRSEVLRLAAKRDRALGEELLEKLKRDKAQEATDAPGPGRRASNLSEALSQRLRLAQQLLEANVPRALEFADPALAAVSLEGLSFLTSLKDKDSTAADRRYLRMLGAAAADMQADANTVSLLSSYIFTPQTFITIDHTGGTSSSQMDRPGPPPAVTAELRSAFFSVATQILMRPLAPPEQDKTTSGLEGKYLIIKRLLPLFEQYASKSTAELMRGQLSALSASVREETRKRDDDNMRRGILPEEEPVDTEQSLLDRISRAKTSAARDQLYVELIMQTLEQADPRARDFVDKLEDSELRKQMRPYVDAILVITFIEKKKGEEAITLARAGELTHFQRVWALSRIARLWGESNRQRALDLSDEAATEARRISGSDPDRPRALIGVANAFYPLDRNRAWEIVGEAVRAANSVEGFSGEDSRIMVSLRTAYMTSLQTSSTENFDLPSMFRTLTKEDYQRAVGLAQNFEADAPRATALISIAREVLSDK